MHATRFSCDKLSCRMDRIYRCRVEIGCICVFGVYYLQIQNRYDRIRQLCEMGGHRTRKVRTLAPGPEGTEKTQDDEEKRDRKIRRMRFRTS